MDREHIFRIGRSSDEGGDSDRGEHQKKAAERKRERKTELLESKPGNVRERPRVAGLRSVRKERDIRPRKEPGRDKLHPDAESQRREPPPGSDKPEPREGDGERKSHDKPDQRRIVGLRAVEIIEKNDHRNVAQKEKSVHHRGEEKRARRHMGQIVGKIEKPREYPVRKRRHRDDALNRQKRRHHKRVQAFEGDVAHPRLRENEPGRDKSAADSADHEHDHLPLAEGRKRVHAVLPVRDDSGDERIRERLRKPLQQQRNIKSRDAPYAEFPVSRFTGPHICFLGHVLQIHAFAPETHL